MVERKRIRKLLQDVKAGKIEIGRALRMLRSFPYDDLGFAKIDSHRDLRKGFPEVILCKGKTLDQIVKIVKRLSAENQFIMATKADKDIYEAIRNVRNHAVYYEMARIVVAGERKRKSGKKVILVVTAGTADLPVAEEAAVTAEIMGNTVERLHDVGVAGVHRLFNYKEKLFSANVIVVVAGMEGALSSLVAGLVDKPVIAVPTSVGYGASFEGLSALLAMLNCCTPGVVVVNIDNGFGAGYFASMVNQMRGKT
jgi:NCAIR mutase (PurE)-related protein